VVRSFWGAIGFCLLMLPSSPALAQRPGELVDRGIAATRAHDLRTALRHFEAALKLDSSHYEANYHASLTLGLLGDVYPMKPKNPHRDSLYARSERYARRAVAANPKGADGHFALAAAVGRASLVMDSESRVHRASLVRDEALRTIALNPRHDGAYHILGRWNAEIMRLPRVSRFVARTFLGARVFDQASWSKAISYMEKAVQLDPGRIYHHLALADIHASRGQVAEAEARLRWVDSLPLREPLDTSYKRQAATVRKRLARH
jgi:tetratricopeptide (TPR) repeat protein